MKFIKKNKKWIGLGLCVSALIGIFLPFATVKSNYLVSISKSVSYFNTQDGKIVFVTLLVSAVLIYLKNDKKFTLESLIIGLVITIIDGVDVSNKLGNLNSSLVSVSLSIGFYIVLISHVLVIILQFIKTDTDIKPTKTIQDSEQQLDNVVSSNILSNNMKIESKICKNCGAKVSETQEFCEYCRNKLN